MKNICIRNFERPLTTTRNVILCLMHNLWFRLEEEFRRDERWGVHLCKEYILCICSKLSPMQIQENEQISIFRIWTYTIFVTLIYNITLTHHADENWNEFLFQPWVTDIKCHKIILCLLCHGKWNAKSSHFLFWYDLYFNVYIFC